MNKIRNSIFGYHRQTVDNIIKEKDSLISLQQNDIDYLRYENQTLHNRMRQTQNQSDLDKLDATSKESTQNSQNSVNQNKSTQKTSTQNSTDNKKSTNISANKAKPQQNQPQM